MIGSGLARKVTTWFRGLVERIRERRRSRRFDSEGGGEAGEDAVDGIEGASALPDDDVFSRGGELQEHYYKIVLENRIPLQELGSVGSEETPQNSNAPPPKPFRYCTMATSEFIPTCGDFPDDETEGSSHFSSKHLHERVPDSDEETVCTEVDLLDEEIEEPDASSGQFRRGSFSLSTSQLQVSKSYAGVIRTRFPPEPNGPLHLGHAKAIHMNFSVACKYGGECILRFDDTNPNTARQEYCDDALEMVRWLGYRPAAVTYTSDYFDHLILGACKLIVKGAAFVCHQPHIERNHDHEMPDSPWRNRSAEENMREFKKMSIGAYKEGEAVLRLKVRTRSGLRDPVAYRICNASHYHTGKRWSIYPTYDFSHPIIDSWEGIAVSLCSSEFVSHRSLYQWVHKKLDLFMVPQREFQRLEIHECMLSKRQLRACLGICFQGYDDPRLATLAGLRRRGIPPQAIRRFVREGYREFDQLLDVTREVLLLQATHCMVVLQPLICYVVNYEEVAAAEGRAGEAFVSLHVPECQAGPYSLGHQVTLTSIIYINKFDFDVREARHYFTPRSPVHLRGTSYTMHFSSMSRGTDGDVVSLRVVLRKMENGKGKFMKVLTWVSEHVPVVINLFDPISRNEASPGSSLPTVYSCKALMEAGPFNTLRLDRYFTYGQTLQAERFAYITLDPPPSALSPSSLSCSLCTDKPRFNVTCLLRLHPNFHASIMQVFKSHNTPPSHL